jgi:hypothetical protein
MRTGWKISFIVLFLTAVCIGNNCGQQEKFSNQSNNSSTGTLTPPIFTASIHDVPALVGWYTYTPNTSTANTTSNPPKPDIDFTNQTVTGHTCPALTTGGLK